MVVCKGEESGESKIVVFGGEIRKLLDLKGKVGKKETEGFVEVVFVVVVVEGLLCCKSWRGGKEVAHFCNEWRHVSTSPCFSPRAAQGSRDL